MSYPAVWERLTQSQGFEEFKRRNPVFLVRNLNKAMNARQSAKRTRKGEVLVSAKAGPTNQAIFGQSTSAYKAKSRGNGKFKRFSEIPFRQERKYFQVNAVNATIGVQNGAGIQGFGNYIINQISNGTGPSSKVGDRICMTGGKIFLQIRPGSGLTQQTNEIDCEVWYWKNPGGTNVSLANNDLYLNDPATSTVTGSSLRNIDYMQDWQLVTSKKVTLIPPGATAAYSNQQVELGFKGRYYSNWVAGTTNMTKGMLILVLKVSNSGPTTIDKSVANASIVVSYNSQIYFVDN